jgi:O-antigen/teichoic acid export membrane protein
VGLRAGQAAAGFLFALVVPRLMGPVAFGQYALVTSMSTWFSLLTGVGVVAMMARSVPAFRERGDTAGLSRFLSGVVAVRALTGAGAALVFVVVATRWLDEVDMVALACVGVGIAAHSIANACFSFFLGSNEAGRWGLGEAARRMLNVPAVLAGYLAGGLRGACAGFLGAHLAALALGLWMCRRHLRLAHAWPDLRFLSPYLRTGASFAGGTVLLALAQRTGEALVQVSTGDFAEVAYFGVAFAAYGLGAQFVWHAAVSFAPLLVGWREQGDLASVGREIGRLLAGLVAVTIASALVVWSAGELLVTAVFGHAYRQAAAHASVQAGALVLLAVSSVLRLVALVANRPGAFGAASAVELGVFWAGGLLFAGRYGGLAVSVAVAAGAAANAATLFWRLRNDVPVSWRAAALAASCAVPALPIVWVRSSWPIEIALGAGALAGYAALVLATGAVSRADVRAWLRRAPSE